MVYLDNAATTQTKFFAKDYYVFGNANTNYVLGVEANKALDKARERIKKCLGVKTGKVVVGGTATCLTEVLINRLKECE